MTIENAKKIIEDNYLCNENSFIYFLYEESCFSVESFWAYYESIAALAGEAEKDPEITRQITHSYQRILKEFLYHFDPVDISVLDNFPENYPDYIERIDFALQAYYSGDTDLLDDEKFTLQKK